MKLFKKIPNTNIEINQDGYTLVDKEISKLELYEIILVGNKEKQVSDIINDLFYEPS